MINLINKPMLNVIAKALVYAGLVNYILPVSANELQMATSLLADINPFLPSEPKVLAALKDHPKVREAKVMANTKRIEADIAKSSPYEWEAGVSIRSRNDRTVTTGSGSSMDQELNLSRSIRLPGKQKIKEHQSESIQMLGETIYGDSLHEASLSLGQQWLECQRLESRADLYEVLGQELKGFSTQQAKRLKAGEISNVEATQAQLALQQIQIETAQNDKQLRTVRSGIRLEFPTLLNSQAKKQCGESNWVERFGSAVNAGTNNTRDYSDSDQTVDLAVQRKWVETIVKLSHPLNIRRIETEVMRDQSQFSREEMLPDPKVGLSYAMERDNAEQIIGLHLSVPLGGVVRKNQSRLSGSELAYSETTLKTLTQQTALEAEQNILDWHQSRRAATLAWEQAKFSANLLKSLEKAYLLGESNATDLTLARQQAQRSQLDAIDNKYNLLQLQARLLINLHQMWSAD
jgi:outer membrane protein, heavy metal efflux system